MKKILLCAVLLLSCAAFSGQTLRTAEELVALAKEAGVTAEVAKLLAKEGVYCELYGHQWQEQLSGFGDRSRVCIVCRRRESYRLGGHWW